MKVKFVFTFLFSVLFVACTNGDLDVVFNNGVVNNVTNVSSEVTGTDLDDLTITADTTSLYEEETIPTDASDASYDDFVENTEFKNVFTVTYTQSGVTVSPSEDDDFTFDIDGSHLTVKATKKAKFILTGSSSDGSFKIYSDSKFETLINGLTLTNPNGAAINSQSKKRMFLVVADGTTNTLCDGSSYVMTDDEDMKGVIFSEGQIVVSGTGKLNITAKGKNGIASDQYLRIRKNVNINVSSSGTNGLKANDAIVVDGGVVNVAVTSSGGKGLTTDGYYEQNGGRVTALTSGGVDTSDASDVSGSAGLKVDSVFYLNDGELNLKSTGQGGKGLSCDQDIYINGGSLTVITSGSSYGTSSNGNNGMRPGGWGNTSSSSSNSVSPKGVRADGNLYVKGGNVKVKCTGGEGSEGLESKKTIVIDGGVIECACYDDCINASTNITVNGGYIYAYASNNDGIDSNGTITITGGVIMSSGTTTPEEGIDCDSNTFTITGGVIIGVGGSTSSPTTSKCTQPTIIYTGSGSSGALLSLDKSDGTNVFVVTIPRSYNQMTLLMSSPDIVKGGSYTLSKVSSYNGGSSFHGLITGVTSVNSASSLKSYSVSSMVTK